MSREEHNVRPKPKKSRRMATSGLRRGIRNPETIIGIIVVIVVLILGIFAPLFATYSPYDQVFGAFEPPSGEHPFGTDELGRDLFARVLFGIRKAIFVGFVGVPTGAVIGTLLGLIGSVSGWLDSILQRFFDVTLAFTGLVMGVTVSVIIGPGLPAVVATVILVNIPLFGRLSRSAVRSQQRRDYVTAAAVVGVPPTRVLFRHILPNALDALIIQAALSFSLAIFLEGGMSFIGIGVRPPEPSLGSLLRTSINFLEQSPTYAIAPMVLVSALVLSFNMIGDGLNKGLLRR